MDSSYVAEFEYTVVELPVGQPRDRERQYAELINHLAAHGWRLVAEPRARTPLRTSIERLDSVGAFLGRARSTSFQRRPPAPQVRCHLLVQQTRSFTLAAFLGATGRSVGARR